jgi:hypothetical protein
MISNTECLKIFTGLYTAWLWRHVNIKLIDLSIEFF